MERQLKERLVGAAVLIAVAVVMVPEMFSGSGSHEVASHKPSSSEAFDSSESGQLKTYRIDLQQRDTAAVSSVSSVPAGPSVPDTHADAIASTAPQRDAVRDTASPTQMAESSSSSRPVSLVDSGQRNVANVNAAHASSSAAHATTPPATPSDGGWSVQLGSFGAEANAKKIVADAKAHGFSAFHSSVKAGGKTLYRVRVGPYADRDAAQAALTKLKRSYAQASLVAPNH